MFGRRLGEALTVPTLTLHQSRLPDPRTLVKGKRASECGAFIDETVRRAESGAVDAEAWNFLNELLPAVTEGTDVEGLGRLVVGGVRVGMAAADVESDRGWAQTGMMDSCVRTLFSWSIYRWIPKTYDYLLHALAMFTAEGAYYQKRVGGNSVEELSRVLLASGMKFEKASG